MLAPELKDAAIQALSSAWMFSFFAPLLVTAIVPAEALRRVVRHLPPSRTRENLDIARRVFSASVVIHCLIAVPLLVDTYRVESDYTSAVTVQSCTSTLGLDARFVALECPAGNKKAPIKDAPYVGRVTLYTLALSGGLVAVTDSDEGKLVN